ncbi:16761_t:CDS:1, partial [Racocetra persica]
MILLDLSHKTAFLVTLGSASRPSDLYIIELKTLQKSESGISIAITDPKEVNISISHCGNRNISKKIFIDYYEDSELCPASAILKLLELTQ